MTGILSRRGAEALVSARLASLGHDEDFITEDALDALRARAGHEADALGAALGAVLFLAATEDAPRIESRHVEQAVPLLETRAPAQPGQWRASQILAAIACGAAMGALVALWLTHRTVIAPAAPAPAPKPQIVAPQTPVVVTAQLPKAPAEPPPPPLVALPAAPPLRVSLVVPAGDRETIARFTGVAARLRTAGLGDVQLETINSAKTDTRSLRHHVVYFFSQDEALAKNVAGALDSAEDSPHIAAHWVPILAPAAAGSLLHPPGSIDVFAP